MSYLHLQKIHGREIIDSRGNPTVEAVVTLANGVEGVRLPYPAARPLASLRRWNCAIKIPNASAVRACSRR